MIIAIDGACKGNGKPDCISTGCAFIKAKDYFAVQTAVSEASTNQRGELMGLILGLKAGLKAVKNEDIFFVTDSEYIYNTITKEWYITWGKRGWLTAAGDPVKNQDLWEIIADLLKLYDMDNFAIFHIKGHIIPFGTVTAQKLIHQDATCEVLYYSIRQKYLEEINMPRSIERIAHAHNVFLKNHGYLPPMEKFNEIVLCNTVADIAASNALIRHLAN